MPSDWRRAAKFLVEHWEQRRSAMEGKAMVVTMSREIAMTLYDEISNFAPSGMTTKMIARSKWS